MGKGPGPIANVEHISSRTGQLKHLSWTPTWSQYLATALKNVAKFDVSER